MLSFHIYIYIYIEWASALVPPTLLLRRGPAEKDRHSHPTQPCWSARAQLCKHSTAQGGHHFDLETPHHHFPFCLCILHVDSTGK